LVTEHSYRDKALRYYSGLRTDIIDQLSADSDRSILEIGCGDGSTGEYAHLAGKCGRYVGVELSPDAAKTAASRIDQVVVGNVESLSFEFEESSFDVLIASEVLEHLVDPWRVLEKLRIYLKPSAAVFASSPNVAHRSTLAMLLRGRWDLTADGRMDRTHLRWFTPATYAEMFEQSGYEVVSVRPLAEPGRLARFINLLTGNRWSYLFVSQIMVEARVRA